MSVSETDTKSSGDKSSGDKSSGDNKSSFVSLRQSYVNSFRSILFVEEMRTMHVTVIKRIGSWTDDSDDSNNSSIDSKSMSAPGYIWSFARSCVMFQMNLLKYVAFMMYTLITSTIPSIALGALSRVRLAIGVGVGAGIGMGAAVLSIIIGMWETMSKTVTELASQQYQGRDEASLASKLVGMYLKAHIANATIPAPSIGPIPVAAPSEDVDTPPDVAPSMIKPEISEALPEPEDEDDEAFMSTAQPTSAGDLAPPTPTPEPIAYMPMQQSLLPEEIMYSDIVDEDMEEDDDLYVNDDAHDQDAT